MKRLIKTTVYAIALMSILITVIGLVAACSSSPSKDMVKNFVIEEIKLEGGKDIKFDLLEVVKIGSIEEGTSWRAEVRMKGTYTQNPHPYFKKVYNFNTTSMMIYHWSILWPGSGKGIPVNMSFIKQSTK